MNRYIKAMELGLLHEKAGISYFDLVNKLQEELDFKFGNESELTFLVWFSQNFRKSEKELTADQVVAYRFYQKKRDEQSLSKEQIKALNDIKTTLNYKYWLNGEAAKQYLDYLELQESRKAAADAKIQSSISIVIAIFALIGSIGFGIYSEISKPIPPYEVKIMSEKGIIEGVEMECPKLIKVPNRN